MAVPSSRRLRLLVIVLVWAALLVVVGMVVLWGPGRPVVKFRPGDRNVAPGEVAEWTFDADSAGGLPPGVEVWDGSWAVRAEADAPTLPNALCQTGSATFPALCLSDRVYTDVEVSLRFKPVSGKEDQAAGIIFRVQDRNNYYILRANALEGNVNFYIYASGRRSFLAGGAAKVASGRWQELRVEVAGNRFRGFLDGQLVVETTNDAYPAGRVGLWTKADSVTCFDNVRVTAR
jgi:hypothetical protein